MGVSFSSPSSSFDSSDAQLALPEGNTKIPKHLKPTKPGKKLHTKLVLKKILRSSGEEAAPVEAATVPAKAEKSPTDQDAEAQERLHRILQQAADQANSPANVISDDDKGIDPFVTKASNERYRWCQGRRFHNTEGIRYFMPNDQAELDRLRVEFFLLKWALQEHFDEEITNSLHDGIEVLSNSFGPGLWLGHPIIDFAHDYKRSKFTCLDTGYMLPDDDPRNLPHEKYKFTPATKDNSTSTSTGMAMDPMTTILKGHPSFTPVHPELSTILQHGEPSGGVFGNNDGSLAPRFPVPSNSKTPEKVFDNLCFQAHGKMLEPLPFPDNSFDLVMQNQAGTACTLDEWKWILEELLRVTKPGGRIQLIEGDPHIYQTDPRVEAWQEHVFEQRLREYGIEPRVASQLDERLAEAGWVNVNAHFVSIPIGSWGLDLGILWEQNVTSFMAAFEPFLTFVWGEDAPKYRPQWRAAQNLFHPRRKCFQNVYLVYAQKPHAS